MHDHTRSGLMIASKDAIVCFAKMISEIFGVD